MDLPKIVAFSGFATSGKDTAAQVLIKEYGYTRLSFADKIRESLLILNPIVQTDNRGHVFRLREVVEEEGWDEAKKTLEIRRLLQVMGTEVGRDTYDQDFWADLVSSQIYENLYKPDCKGYVITDVRYENEVSVIASFRPYSFLIKILRPDTGPVNSHSSDKGLPNHLFDTVIMNDGTIPELHADIIQHLRAGR